MCENIKISENTIQPSQIISKNILVFLFNYIVSLLSIVMCDKTWADNVALCGLCHIIEANAPLMYFQVILTILTGAQIFVYLFWCEISCLLSVK